ncbi:MAG: TonB-dependent receptor [Flavobacterium sp.]|uniref:TonB-dependent receptor n=1 Tax=Flavobacterium sp. TaxID=239 RepID=UPI001B1B01EA|nr:TonB-dependent receptor [Flavobacterium sp.]MBO9585307.1 TonB-dependent receptor [Flavobacterium sp.]
MEKKIIIEKEKDSIGAYINAIITQGVNLSLSNNKLNLGKQINISAGTYRLRTLLNLIFASEPVKFLERDSKIIIYTVSRVPDPFTISGFVYAADSKEALPNATVRVLNTNIAVNCNDYGYYAITLPENRYIINASYTGFNSQTDTITVNNTIKKNFNLAMGLSLAPVEIRPSKKSLNEISSTIDAQHVNALPFLMGQSDPLKLLTLKSGTYGSSLNVRGGTSGQNLVLLDGVPIYNYNHFIGLSSIFDSQAVKQINFFKGGYPARYEGRLSSVIDVKTKDGDMQSYHGAVNIGLLTGSAVAEGPIIKDKMSFMISARRSWLDAFNRGNNFKYNMYDAYFKVNYFIDSSNRIYLGAYTGGDLISSSLFNEPFHLTWNNRAFSLRWNRVYSPRLFQNSVLLLSSYNNLFADDNEKETIKFRITDVGIENNLNYHWSSLLNSSIGFRINMTCFSNKNMERDQLIKSLHFKTYWDNDVTFSDKFRMKSGLHYAVFLTNSKVYNSFQPRINFVYQYNGTNSFFASFAVMEQFYHQIVEDAYALPTDLRMPSTDQLPPEKGSIYEIGYEKTLSKGYLKLEFYEKKSSNILMHQPGFNTSDKIAMQPPLIGFGSSRGLELEFSKRFKKFDVQTSYTLSRSALRFPAINNGQTFSSPNDITNQIKGTVNWNFNQFWVISMMFNYSSGHLVSAPDSFSYSDKKNSYVMAPNQSSEISRPYNYRLPRNYNIDIGASKTKKMKSGCQTRLYFGVNNFIGQSPPFLIDTSLTDGTFNLEQIRMFKFLPYVGYTYIFGAE